MGQTNRVAALAVLLFTIWFAAACREPNNIRYEKRLRDTAKPALHVVHSDRLNVLMEELQHLTFAHLPQELDVNLEKQRRIREVSTVAGGMAEAAGYIPEVLTEVDLSAKHAAQFRKLAANLEEAARRLEERAAELSVNELGDEFVSIISTCDACHARFRVLPVIESPDKANPRAPEEP